MAQQWFESVQWSVKNTFVHCPNPEKNAPANFKWTGKSDKTHARDQKTLDYLRDMFSRSSSFEDGTADTTCPESDDVEEELEEEQLQNAQQPGVQLSVGAEGHAEGNCKPCAWNWKPSGCSKGSACDFCHMCEDGAVKSRKKEKIKNLRQAEKAQKRAARLQREQEA